MRYQQLKYFLEVCETQSFNQAAKNLYTTQPNISKTIQQLEKQLGHDLFIRTPSGTFLTAYGEKIRHHALHAVMDIDQIFNDNNEVDVTDFGLAMENTFWASQILVDYAAANPKMKIKYYQKTNEGVINCLISKKADIGLMFIPENLLRRLKEEAGSHNLLAQTIGSCKLAVFTSKDSELASKEYLDFAELKDIPLIGRPHDYYSFEHQLSRISNGVLEEEHLQEVYYSEEGLFTRNAIVKGLGSELGIAGPNSLLEEEIVQIPIRACPEFLKVVCVYNQVDQGKRKIQEFIDFVISVGKAL